MVEAQISATRASTSVVFASGPRYCTQQLLNVDLREIFEYAHLKFTVSGRSKHTHTRAQCSHASVGLAQARPNHHLRVVLMENEEFSYNNLDNEEKEFYAYSYCSHLEQ